MTKEEQLLRTLIRESIAQNQINEFNLGSLFGSKNKTSDNAVEAAKKVIDGHLSGKFEKSPEILKKAFNSLPPEDKKKYSAKLKAKHGKSKELSDEEIDSALKAAGNADDAKRIAKIGK